ncbi:MAG: hypothetical protein LC772_11995, partial [Chloroflexi bacterium]|nr:hypothetical protein [Chloroflexota bacterium]
MNAGAPRSRFFVGLLFLIAALLNAPGGAFASIPGALRNTGTLDTGTLDTGTLDTGTLDTGTSASTALSSRRQRFLPVNGKPAFLAYAKGLTDSFDLTLYRELGFTTLVVDVPWKASMDYGPADIMIRSAGRLGIGAIVQLHPGEPPSSLQLRVDPANPEYQKAVSGYLQDAGKHFRAFPGVDAILLEDDSEQHVQVDDDGFRQFLSRIYPDIRELNRVWGTSLSSMSQVTMDSACRMSEEQYGGLSIPCLQVGEYRSGAYGSILDEWARELHQADPVHPLVMGRQDLPRAAILTPTIAAGVVVAAAPPGVAAVDVARRGGRFAAIVEVSGPESEHYETLSSQ